MTQQFLVAGHRFALTMADTSPLWGRLGNYAPFRTDAGDGALFVLEYVERMDPVVKVPVYTEKAEDPDQPRIEIYRNGNLEDPRDIAWIFEMAPLQSMNICARMTVSADFSRAQLATANTEAVGEFAVNNALMLLFAFRTAPLGTLELHASVILNGGFGYLFLGKSGTGKSTHSRLWLNHIPGSELLNDDNPIIRIGEDGAIRVYGSPWSGKTPCYRNLDAPVGAIVRLNQYPENRIRRCSLFEAYATVYPSCSGLRAIPEIGDGMHASIEKVALEIPCYVLDCLPDAAAARLSHDTIAR